MLKIKLLGFTLSLGKDQSGADGEIDEGQKASFLRKKRLILIIVAIIVIFFIIGSVLHRDSDNASNPSENNGFYNSQKGTSGLSPAVAAGKQLSNNQCEGEGVPYKLTRSPMDPEDFSMVVPYGLLAGEHVTPIDHQYFSPKDFNSPLDAYEVYAMGDATIVEVEEREGNRNGKTIPNFRLVFSITCTYFYYYDLVTSLTPDIKKEYEAARKGVFKRPVAIKVKEGQLIGRIGGQTLDFAVWDTTKRLTGFVVPEHYNPEPWKIYTADPLNYYSDELKKFILSRYVRTVEPISGKIDYDIDGKLIGNWFLEGTNNYAGGKEFTNWQYWKGHFAVVPDHIDPTGVFVSFGDFNGEAIQFFIQDLYIRPENVDTNTGVVRYELGQHTYQKENGGFWDNNSVAQGIKIVPARESQKHCVLLQLIETRKLKMEYFPNTKCSANFNFTPNAKFYLR